MWRRGRNRANPGMVPAWGKSSSNRGMGSNNSLCRTHGGTALGSGGSRRGHNSGGGGSDGGRRSCGGGRSRVGLADRGRRGVTHPRFGVVSFARLHHG